MKLAKIVVLILLIAKSSIAFGQVNLFFSGNHDSCHGESIELSEDHNSSSEDEGCCDTGSCDCLCCGHIFTFSFSDTKSSELPVFNSSISDHYAYLYHFNFSDGIWQPPKVV